MSEHSPSQIAKTVGLVCVIGLAFFATYQIVIYSQSPVLVANEPLTPQQTTDVALAAAAISTTTVSTTTQTIVQPLKATSTVLAVKKSSAPITKALLPTKTASSTIPTGQVERLQNPYTTPPISFETINNDTRNALVDIFCQPKDGSFNPISGSGVIIDSRGVILTNAHVAQYVLLSEDLNINLSCVVRVGSPATARYTAQVLYIPPIWVNAHASDINAAHATGTGEHDYALLYITGTTNGSALPQTFPFVSPDTRDRVAFLGDSVLGAGYPAEFIGSSATQSSLYAVSSVSTVSQLLTFGNTTIDAISIGNVIEAQSGSSGGAVVNGWDRLVGIITTTSDGATTAQRNLRAVTLSYINRDILQQSGQNLTDFLAGDLPTKVATFTHNTAPDLLTQYINVLSK